MRLVVQTKIGRKKASKKLYMVSLPNWYDVSGLPELMNKVEKAIPEGEKVAEYMLYSNSTLTIEEKNDLDLRGKIETQYIKLEIDHESER